MAVAPEPEGEQDGIIRAAADLPGALVDRGIGFQAVGFAVVLLASTTLLKLFQGSSFWLYQWFDIAATGTYWSSLVPLAALFDWMRKMFERGKAIREAKKAEIRAEERRKGIELGIAQGRAEGRTEGRAEGRTEGRAEGRTEGRAEGRTEGRAEGLAEGIELGRAQSRTAEIERIRVLLESSGLALPPEIAEAMFGDDAKNGS